MGVLQGREEPANGGISGLVRKGLPGLGDGWMWKEMIGQGEGCC